jgi:hypothetical protein
LLDARECILGDDMKMPSNRRLWIVATAACLGLFFELFVIVRGFNAPSASHFHRNAFRWDVVCAALAPVALVLAATLDEKRLRTSIIVAFVAFTGPLFVFLSMLPAHPIYCFIQEYRSEPFATLGKFSLLFLPLIFMAGFVATLYQRSRSIAGVTPWPQ